MALPGDITYIGGTIAGRDALVIHYSIEDANTNLGTRAEAILVQQNTHAMVQAGIELHRQKRRELPKGDPARVPLLDYDDNDDVVDWYSVQSECIYADGRAKLAADVERVQEIAELQRQINQTENLRDQSSDQGVIDAYNVTITTLQAEIDSLQAIIDSA